MIRLRQLELPITEDNYDKLIEICSKKLKITSKDIKYIKIHKKSIDARKKPNIYYVYEVDVKLNNEIKILKKYNSNDIFLTPNERYKFPISGTNNLINNIIIVGSGPAGLFCGYMLAHAGYQVMIIERGDKIEKRVEKVEKFWETGFLNTESNVQFGEGGAGTFSDGKLNTLIKDPFFRQKKILEIFVSCGAPKEILYINKPHIGTDILRKVIINMRNKMIKMGVIFKYNTCLTDIEIINGKINKIILNNNEQLNVDVLVLALGHSARDTFKMLYDKNISMISKPFAVGIRIMHPQKLIDINRYGISNKMLPPASYKLTYKAKNNRGVYTFCMCPGGYVVNSSSENGRLAINGMSNYKRDSNNANSAIIVTVNNDDYGNNTLDGINFQRKLEESAYKLGNGKVPIQLYEDFKNNRKTSNLGNVLPTIKGDYTFSNLSNLFPKEIYEALINAIDYFGTKINGFDSGDAIIAAIESRTSSPVRIVRNDNYEANIAGIYSCGEGAGYAGGITSAAIDGIKIAEAIAGKFIPNKKL